uniref:Uncharacterized protein n=1 Tax=Dromaius novaehollandiae TaxID=8790 RepID=A0A8C4IYT3_DRONO
SHNSHKHLCPEVLTPCTRLFTLRTAPGGTGVALPDVPWQQRLCSSSSNVETKPDVENGFSTRGGQSKNKCHEHASPCRVYGQLSSQDSHTAKS